jgi:hypothetical protein
MHHAPEVMVDEVHICFLFRLGLKVSGASIPCVEPLAIARRSVVSR